MSRALRETIHGLDHYNVIVMAGTYTGRNEEELGKSRVDVLMRLIDDHDRGRDESWKRGDLPRDVARWVCHGDNGVTRTLLSLERV